MINKKLLSALICPKCKGSINQNADERVICSKCGQQYPIQNNIPLISSDTKTIIKNIETKKIEKPIWYTENQFKNRCNYLYRHHLKKRKVYLKNVFKKYGFSAFKIFDAGCGDGANIELLSDIYDSEIIGMDYNLLRLQRARTEYKNNSRIHFLFGSLLEQCFKDNYFDLVFLSHVLEHIPDDRKVLSNLYKILKPGGFLILGIPNEGAFLWQLDYRFIEPKIMRTTDHVHFYTVKKVKDLLQKTNFNIEEIKYIGWGMPHTVIDGLLRQYRIIDDLFESIGSRFFKSQATSLYFICKK